MQSASKTAMRGARPALPGVQKPDAADIEAMIRVDHAGEFGALRIYQGQLAILSRNPRAQADVQAINHMAAQEQKHFDAFTHMVKTRPVRPTALEPVWRVAGYALGAATALMGQKAAMACTAAVEEVIDEHYASQLPRLSGDTELRTAVEDFRGEEIAHRNEALAHGAEQAAGYRL